MGTRYLLEKKPFLIYVYTIIHSSGFLLNDYPKTIFSANIQDRLNLKAIINSLHALPVFAVVSKLVFFLKICCILKSSGGPRAMIIGHIF